MIRYTARNGTTFDRDTRSAQLFGFMELPFDDSGRFIMPEYLVELGGLEEQVFFQGGGAFFSIWNPDKLMAMGDDWAAAKAACKALMGEAAKPKRGAK